MKNWNWLMGILVVILLLGTGTNTYFYVQQSSRLSQVDQRISGLADNLTAVQAGVSVLQGNVTTLQGNVAGLQGSVTSLQGTVTGLGQSVTALQGTTAGLSSDVTGLKGSVTSINSSITAINGSLSSLSGNVTSLGNTVNGLQSSVNNMQSSITALQANDQAVLNVVAKLEPAVVLLTITKASMPNYIFGGSGVIVRNNGYILTNYHVIEGASTITATLKGIGNIAATVAATDQNRDLAVVKLNSPRTDFPIATLGSSAAVKVGDDAIAIGFPEQFDLSNPPYTAGPATFTKGIISAVRVVDGYQFIQTDAAINHGNSGGPLVNMKGEVIGINMWRLFWDESTGDPADNLGFAIPIDDAKALIVKAAGA